jgi:hypothetical protein
MKISRLQQLVFASALVAVPSMAARPSVGASAPVSLCGDAKGSDEKADNGSKDDSSKDGAKSDDKKADKKDSKDKKASKGSV